MDVVDRPPELFYVNTMDIKEEEFPRSPKVIAKEQLKDKHLQKLFKCDKKKQYYLKK